MQIDKLHEICLNMNLNIVKTEREKLHMHSTL